MTAMTYAQNGSAPLLKNTLRKWNVTATVFVVLFVMLISIHMYSIQQYSIAARGVWYRSTENRSWFGGECQGCCRPATDVFLLKTHKCASSTLQNILMRFGDRRNLSFALPAHGNYFGHPEPFSRSMIPSYMTPSWGFNIFCHHTRFNIDESSQLMPPETVFITILRDPASLFESLYAYYDMLNHTGLTLEDFLKSDRKRTWLDRHRYVARFGRNQMLFDLGYDASRFKNASNLEDAIREVDRNFHLVLIAELFDESLILMRDLLCWDTQDVVYFHHNQRKQKVPVSDKKLRMKMLAYNAADHALYRYFRQKLENMIEKYGRERMRQEVDGLQLWKNLLYSHCVEKLDSGTSAAFETRAYSDDVYSIVLREGIGNRVCLDMARAELPYTNKLRAKQKNLAQCAHPFCNAFR
ncbi:galactosylceramide sulfotransferase-like isoform X2 [Ornithodoros turicata]|uniref:galactosylceramide sulfotransferase-like isoform X2 n=1 Tax=Ornithodoros turicata TaxID=34597 RepID=UPI00313A3D0F